MNRSIKRKAVKDARQVHVGTGAFLRSINQPHMLGYKGPIYIIVGSRFVALPDRSPLNAAGIQPIERMPVELPHGSKVPSVGISPCMQPGCKYPFHASPRTFLLDTAHSPKGIIRSGRVTFFIYEFEDKDKISKTNLIDYFANLGYMISLDEDVCKEEWAKFVGAANASPLVQMKKETHFARLLTFTNRTHIPKFMVGTNLVEFEALITTEDAAKQLPDSVMRLENVRLAAKIGWDLCEDILRGRDFSRGDSA